MDKLVVIAAERLMKSSSQCIFKMSIFFLMFINFILPFQRMFPGPMYNECF